MSKRSKDIHPYWRPNFVDTSRLPDIKVVRTHFVINIVAVTLLCLAAAAFVQKEYRAFILTRTIAELKDQIEVATPENRANLKLSGEFRTGAADIADLEVFYLTPFRAYAFLQQLSAARPEELIFNEVSFREEASGPKTMVYQILISGEVRFLTTLDEFTSFLDDWEMLQIESYELSIDEAVEGRDAATGIFPYRLNIGLTPKAAKNGEEDS